YKGPQYKHEAMTNLGASEYLEKPVNPEVLLEAVNRLLTAEEDIEDVLPDLETVIALVNTRGR
ncbi:MAG: response regulator, partial [Candidatus Aminicenantales bacterium]